jgi:hypothetical protein
MSQPARRRIRSVGEDTAYIIAASASAAVYNYFMEEEESASAFDVADLMLVEQAAAQGALPDASPAARLRTLLPPEAVQEHLNVNTGTTCLFRQYVYLYFVF